MRVVGAASAAQLWRDKSRYTVQIALEPRGNFQVEISSPKMKILDKQCRVRISISYLSGQASRAIIIKCELREVFF